ncbi:hypothetical protein LTR10_006829 [Elasticomyces elasticus]|nr:hypothetical protein LTR10_006829 [Elasticomyces elasticus]KAK4972768.1 hypothetical protein LTR42_006062 [Elasticomyces elasticus]
MDSISPSALMGSILTPSTIIISLLATPALYLLSIIAYNLLLHPLRSYPGPLLYRALPFFLDYQTYTGTLIRTTAALHVKYGPVVRMSPNQLSFTSGQIYQDVWAHKAGHPEWPKDPMRGNKPPNGLPNILSSEKDDHARYRRLLAHAFSEKGLQEQQPQIKYFVDLLIDRLGEFAKSGGELDMVQWYNMTLFDLIGDLAWGETFHCLRDRRVHEWIPMVYESVRFVILRAIFRQYGLDFLTPYFVSKKTQADRVQGYVFAKAKIEKRIALGAVRGDFWDRVMIKSADGNAKGEGMSEGEMLNNATVLILGGSETSATTLSGATYLLLTNPEKMTRLVNEIRSEFKSSDDIDALSVGRLKYLLAVIEEAMRVYPPVPAPVQRLAPKGGGVACGKHVPEGTSVSVSVIGACHDPANFHRPEDFVPERWLDDAPDEFANDDRSAHRPFVEGTRNCIGRNLAYAEMKLILAKVLWHFDFELMSDKTGDWFDQKAWALWDKKPLYVKVREAKR